MVKLITMNSSPKVAIARAPRYDAGELHSSITRCLDLIGGLDMVVRSGAKVFVKINHLPPPSPPERGIVTHPVFTEAVLQLLKEVGADITVGDDVEAEGADGFVLSGYREMCKRLGMRLVNLRETGFTLKKCDGRALKEVYISRVPLESDVIINLSKLKTHSLTLLTGGVKNMYGCIPIGLRRRFHGDFLRVEDFCRMLVDVYSLVPPHLTIMDGVMAMEGEGPGNGQMRNLGLVLASRDAVALDAVAGQIIGLEPADVLTTRFASERGLGAGDLSRIEIVGEKIDSVAVSNFKLPAAVSRVAVGNAPRFLGKFVVSQISPQPHVRKNNCTACGECVKACPTGAIAIPEDFAVVDYASCIRCMCCHEVCRFNAIIPRRPFLGNVIYGGVKGVRRVAGGKTLRTRN
ncbi:MAG: DUF362 domain-containing protein [Dehalococcoidia bacterium]|nr:DUF362 domain-containing protein [Dehalococcoidia bacterium]